MLRVNAIFYKNKSELSTIPSAIKTGLKESAALGISFFLLYIVMGMLCCTQSFTLAQTMALTCLIFSTPLQFLIIDVSDNYDIAFIPVILAMNSRFLLMSAALVPALKETSLLKIMAVTVLIIPSIFTSCVDRYHKTKNSSFEYFLALGLPIYFLSLLCTFIGFFFIGDCNYPPLYAMIQMALPLQFTAIVAKCWPHYLYLFSYLAGLLLTPILYCLFRDYNLLLTPFTIAITLMIFEELWKKWIINH
jgi:predicted branched-subunit amino acid permease